MRIIFFFWCISSSFFLTFVVMCNGAMNLRCYDAPNRAQIFFCQCLPGEVYNGIRCVAPLPCSPQNSSKGICNPASTCNTSGLVYSCNCPLGRFLDGYQCGESISCPINTVCNAESAPKKYAPQNRII